MAEDRKTVQFGDRDGSFRLFDTKQANFGIYGYHIVKWLDLSGNEYAPLSSVLYSDISAFGEVSGETSGIVHLSAKWEKDWYGISAVNVPAECSSSIYGVDHVYEYESTATLTAGDEDENYSFSHWDFSDGSSVQVNPVTLQVLAPVEITANFRDLRTILMQAISGIRTWRYNQLSADLDVKNILAYRAPDAAEEPFTLGPFNEDPELSNPNALVALDLAEENINGVSDRSFYGCGRLLTANCRYISAIGESSFEGCSSLVSSVFPELLFVGSRAFFGCSNMTSAYMPDVKDILSGAFAGCTSLKSVDFPNLSSIGARAFDCGELSSALLEIRCPNLRDAAPSAFYGCENLTAVDGISSITSIKKYTFSGCEKIKMFNLLSARDIGTGAMFGCKSVTAMYMPAVSAIGLSAFCGCDKLKIIDFGYTLSSVPELDSTAFKGLNDVTCYIPNVSGLYDAWIETEGWSAVTSNYDIAIVQHTQAESPALAYEE